MNRFSVHGRIGSHSNKAEMKEISRSTHIQKMRGLPCYRVRPLLIQLISFEITQLQYQQHRDKSRPTRLNISIRPWLLQRSHVRIQTELYDDLPLNVGFQATFLFNLQAIRNNAVKVPVQLFEVLFKSSSTYCELYNNLDLPLRL